MHVNMPFTHHITALIIPAAYHASHSAPPYGEPPLPDDGTRSGLLLISHGTSIILLLVYVAYLWFQLKTHAYLFNAPGEEDEAEESKMNLPAAGVA